MNLTSLTGPHLITLQTRFADRDAAIHALADRLDQAASTHMQLLTPLTTTLVDDDTREAVLAAQSAEQLITLLDGEGDSGKQPPKKDKLDINQPTVVCVTACQAEIPHTYIWPPSIWKKRGANLAFG